MAAPLTLNCQKNNNQLLYYLFVYFCVTYSSICWKDYLKKMCMPTYFHWPYLSTIRTISYCIHFCSSSYWKWFRFLWSAIHEILTHRSSRGVHFTVKRRNAFPYFGHCAFEWAIDLPFLFAKIHFHLFFFRCLQSVANVLVSNRLFHCFAKVFYRSSIVCFLLH